MSSDPGRPPRSLQLDGVNALAWQEPGGTGGRTTEQLVVISNRGYSLITLIFSPLRGRTLGAARGEVEEILDSLRWK